MVSVSDREHVGWLVASCWEVLSGPGVALTNRAGVRVCLTSRKWKTAVGRKMPRKSGGVPIVANSNLDDLAHQISGAVEACVRGQLDIHGAREPNL